MQMHSTRDISVLTKREEGGGEEGAISITASRACLRKGRQFSGKIILLPSRFHQPSSKRSPASRNPSSSSVRIATNLFSLPPFSLCLLHTSLFTHPSYVLHLSCFFPRFFIPMKSFACRTNICINSTSANALYEWIQRSDSLNKSIFDELMRSLEKRVVCWKI